VRAVKEVSTYLGNTPAVARGSYIDPRVFDRYQDGISIAGVFEDLGAQPGDTAIQGPVEAAVIDLIAEHDNDAVVRTDELAELVGVERPRVRSRAAS
jgi:DNA topoisomerase-1